MSNVMARAEKIIEDFDAGLIAHLDLDEAIKVIIGRAEARAAELEAKLKRSNEQYDDLLAESVRIQIERDNALAERDRANQGFAVLSKEYDKAMTRLAAHGEKVTA